MNKYFDEMTDLLFERKLRAANLESEARTVARARTLTALRELDGERKGQLVRFLQEAKLIGGDKPVVNLSLANLSDADLSLANLSLANLSLANLSLANLSSTDLSSTDLRFADLSLANLSNARLRDADLKRARFCKTKMPDGKENNQDCPQKQLP